nr:MAG TPA: hypothetical protein [Caudoviricetes sp.]
MATASFDRKMFIPKEEMNHFLEIITEAAKSIKTIPDIEKTLRKNERILKNIFYK